MEIKFSQPVAIGGIKTDSSEELPYKVECLTKAGVWEVVKENCRGTTRLDSTVMGCAPCVVEEEFTRRFGWRFSWRFSWSFVKSNFL